MSLLEKCERLVELSERFPLRDAHGEFTKLLEECDIEIADALIEAFDLLYKYKCSERKVGKDIIFTCVECKQVIRFYEPTSGPISGDHHASDCKLANWFEKVFE